MSPFTLHIPDADIADLRARLARTRWPDAAPGEPWAYGTSVDYLRGLVDYWRDGFDWRAQEAKLNAYPQFRTSKTDIDLHWLHVPGKGPNPTPLLLMHGWPGSVFEFVDFIPRLTDPAAYEAVAEAVKAAGIPTVMSEVTMVASTYTRLEGAAANQMIRLIDTLEDLDDVQNVYSNFDMDEDQMESVG